MEDYYRLGYKCPYFVKTGEYDVYCERGCRLVFVSHKEAKTYLHRFCNSFEGYRKCTIATMLSNYWEEVLTDEDRRQKRSPYKDAADGQEVKDDEG